jgi:hypothetical protein
MAFTDPITITINAVAKVLARIMSDGQSAVYQNADGTYKLTISHTISKGRIRSMARLDQRAIVPDPLTAVNDYETFSSYYVTDRPEVGFTAAQVDQQRAGFFAWMNTAVSDKIYGQES